AVLEDLIIKGRKLSLALSGQDLVGIAFTRTELEHDHLMMVSDSYQIAFAHESLWLMLLQFLLTDHPHVWHSKYTSQQISAQQAELAAVVLALQLFSDQPINLI
ncbi:hypothetical protein E2320_000016, partial [Naja naja]